MHQTGNAFQRGGERENPVEFPDRVVMPASNVFIVVVVDHELDFVENLEQIFNNSCFCDPASTRIILKKFGEIDSHYSSPSIFNQALASLGFRVVSQM